MIFVCDYLLLDNGGCPHFSISPSIDIDTMIVPDIYDTIRKDADFKKAKDPSVEKFFTDSLNENDGFFVVVPLS